MLIVVKHILTEWLENVRNTCTCLYTRCPSMSSSMRYHRAIFYNVNCGRSLLSEKLAISHENFLLVKMLQCGARRRFKQLNMHNRLLFSITKIPHSRSAVFSEERPRGKHMQRVLVKFDVNEERKEGKSFHETHATLNEVLHAKGHRNVTVNVFVSGWNGRNNYVSRVARRAQLVSIRNSVEEISDKCFYGCENLIRVSFGESSSLKRIGLGAFSESGLREIHIPDTVEEICDKCFYMCRNLSHVTIRESSALKRIGFEAFSRSDLTDIHIPDGVEEICDRCFGLCRSLSRVTFRNSSLKRIGIEAFRESGLREIRIPDGVEEVGDKCFYMCRSLSRVIISESSSLKRIGFEAFGKSTLEHFSLPVGVISVGVSAFECPLSRVVILDPDSRFTVINSLLLSRDRRICYTRVGQSENVVIPDTVEEICDRCCYEYGSLSRVTFGKSPSLKRIGAEAFCRSRLTVIHCPDTVEEICDKCFAWCLSLSLITFTKSSSLKRIGVGAFYRSGLEDIHIPGSVEEICDECFCECMNLQLTTFDEPSSLKRIGKGAFRATHLVGIRIPDSVEEICDQCFCLIRRPIPEMYFPVIFGQASSLQRIGAEAFCGSFPSITLPKSVISVGGSAFECEMESFVISDASSSFTVVERLLLSKDRRFCYCCIGQLADIAVPDSVEEICDKCFYESPYVSRVTFGESSSLKRIGREAFHGSRLREIHLPSSVEELGDKCFFWCACLSRVTFGRPSSLRRIGIEAFSRSDVKCLVITESVEEVCDRCFCECRSLSTVRVGMSTSALKRIGEGAFHACGLKKIRIPVHLESLIRGVIPSSAQVFMVDDAGKLIA